MTSPSPNSSIHSHSQAPATELGGGRYVVTGSLGAGSQGETLDCVDKREGRPVAIKRFVIRGARSWKDVELAEREAMVLSTLRHRALPRYIEHFEEDGALYLVMDKVEGETLAARRKRGARLDQQQVVRFLEEAGECLRYLHGQAPPVVHRDIKPSNVILRPDGSYCLVDFGSVRDRLKPEGGSTVVGTFGFMAPEQFQGRAAPGSDVYAVAATALSLLTGQEPEDLPHKGLAIDVESALRGGDRRLVSALRSMLEPDPDRRATSVSAALRQAGVRSGEPPHGSAQETKQARRARASQSRFDDAEDFGATRKQNRRERKAARKAERQARREQRRAWRRPGRRVPPGVVLGYFVLLALRVASLATFLLFQVLLPALFTLLTVVAGERMAERGRRMIEIGRAGRRGLARAREHINHQLLGGPEPESLPERSAPPPRQRVADDAAAFDAESDLELELERQIEEELDAAFDPKRHER